MDAETLSFLAQTRLHRPEAIARAAAARTPADGPTGPSGRCFVIAADHPARGALGVGGDPLAMADRGDLLDRLRIALANPGCNGVLATADLLDDLLLLGALEGKTVFGSMNRGGLAGASWEIDDRFTGMNAAGIERMRFDGGKMLTRIDYGDERTAPALEAAARAVDDLSGRGLIAMVEPFLSTGASGRVVNDLRTEAVVRSAAVASGLGATSARTWLKLPTVPDMARVCASSTLPIVLLGGEVDDPDAQRAKWSEALEAPNVIGLTVGRSLLYPADGDVAGAIEKAVNLL